MSSLNYKKSGVSIDRANTFIKNIAPMRQMTKRAEDISPENGFAGLFQMPCGYQKPVLVSSTDGVGTKLKIAFLTQQHNTIGRDLVAMCVNDILVYGAEPLWFLDYFACGNLENDTAVAVVKGIAEGCCEAGCVLLGGETAEMPEMYQRGEYDLAGFAVGVAEHERLLGGHRVALGDVIIGVSSSGLHANGFSLVRRIVENAGIDWGSAAPWNRDSTVAEELLTPTLIYAKAVRALVADNLLHAAAHITGGGLTDNIPRALGDEQAALINLGAWDKHAVFDWLQTIGKIETDEMLNVFNCGIGLALVVASENAEATMTTLQGFNLRAWRIGEVVAGSRDVIYAPA